MVSSTTPETEYAQCFPAMTEMCDIYAGITSIWYYFSKEYSMTANIKKGEARFC